MGRKKRKGKGYRLWQEAVKEAKKEANRAHASVTIQKKHGKIEKRESFNPNRQAPKQH
jgi:hypothetical protein